MATGTAQIARLNELITRWEEFRKSIPEPNRYCKLRQDLYEVRNAGWQDNPPLSTWPKELLDPDDSMMAAVEHYFLCRCWVGDGKYPAWEMRALSIVYDVGKVAHITPRHNPNKPVTPVSILQMAANEAGIRDGKRDLIRFSRKAPVISMPPTY